MNWFGCVESVRPDWKFLVTGIQNKDGAAIETFFVTFSDEVRRRVRRRIWRAASAEDCIRDALTLSLEGVGLGRLREAANLPAYVRGVVDNVINQTIAIEIADRRSVDLQFAGTTLSYSCNIENEISARQNREIMQRALAALSPIRREILRRFYLSNESADSIRLDLRLTSTQFRLHKARAKTQLIQRVKCLSRQLSLDDADHHRGT